MNAGVHHYEDKLLDYAYGELPAHEASAVDAHVRTCTKCNQALEQIRGVRSVFAPLPKVEAPEAGLESLLAYAEQHARRARGEKQAPWRRWLLVLASGAALLVVGVVAVRASDESPQSAAELVAASEKSVKSERSRVAEAQAKAPSAAPEWPAADAPKAALGGESADLGGREAKRGAAMARSDDGYGDTFQDVVADKRGRRPSDANTKELPEQKQLATLEAAKRAAEKDGKPDPRRAAVAESEQSPAEQPTGRTSAARREAPSKLAGDDSLRLDYGNAGRAVAMEESLGKKGRPSSNLDEQLNDGTNVRQSMVGNAAGPGFGVSSGSSLGGPVAGGRLNEPRPSVPAQPAPVASAPPPPAQAPAAPMKKSKSGYGGLLPSSASREADDDAAPATESLSRSGDGERRQVRDQQLNVDAQLEQARAAASAGDRRGEVMAAIAALNAGAAGYARAEALKRACDGYDALGEVDRASAYCDRLLAEFGGTAAARQVAQRRKAQLKDSASTKSKADVERAEPASAPTY